MEPDIVERLRTVTGHWSETADACEAAAEIERLRAELAAVRSKLKHRELL